MPSSDRRAPNVLGHNVETASGRRVDDAKRGTAMGWPDAHRYNKVLSQAMADLERTDGVLVWRDDYRDVFETPHGLMLALRSRWETMLRAQVEYVWDPSGRVSDDAHRLESAHAGLVRALRCAAEAVEVTKTEVELVGAA